MEPHFSISFLLVILSAFIFSSQAYTFFVGGKDGWVLNPSENFNHWAERNRFQINDSLIFKYKKGSDSILVVNKDDYYKCDKTKPIQELNGGDSEFKFDRSGAFFFISGHADHCEKGQKLIVIVLSQRNIGRKAPTPAISVASPGTSPSPVTESPVESPRNGAPEPSVNTGDFYAPAPAPADSAAVGGSVNLVLCLSSVGMSVVLGSLVGLV